MMGVIAGEAPPADDFFVTGGTVPPGSPSYVERSADREIREALLSGEYCYVLNSRQMGKSSLAVRTVQQLKASGIRTAFVDLTRIGGATVSVEQWYTGLLVETGRAVGLRTEAVAYIREHKELGPAQRYLSFLQDVALPAEDSPLVVMVDEIDATRGLSFPADEFFTGIRQMHNARAVDPELKRLTFCLLGAALPSDLIRDPRTTPFNIGRMIDLTDFTLENAQPFGQALGPAGAQRLARVMYWTSGHPYLTQVLCAELAKGDSLETDALVRDRYLSPRASESDTNLVDVANRLLSRGDPAVDDRARADTLSLYDLLLRHKEVPDDEANDAVCRIKMSGIVRSTDGKLHLRNRIYSSVFNRAWVAGNMPGQESRRQKRAYTLGVLRTGAIAAVILSIIAFLAASNYRLANQFQKQRDDARYDSYVTSMVDANALAEQHDVDRLQDAIDVMAESPYRGWEWHYWNRIAHSALTTIKLPDDGYRDGPVAVSRDGSFAALLNRTSSVMAIASLSDDQTVRRVELPRLDRPEIEVFDGAKQVVIFGRRGQLSIVNQTDGSIALTELHADMKWVGGELAVRRGELLGQKGANLVSFDLKTHQVKILGPVGASPIRNADVSPDGRFVSWISGELGDPSDALDIFDRATWKEVAKVPSVADNCRPAWSPVGNRLALGVNDEGSDSTTLELYDIGLRKSIRDRLVHRGELGRLSFSGDGKRLLVSGMSNSARLYDAEHLDSPAIAVIPVSFRGFASLMGGGERILTKSWNLRVYKVSSFLSDTVNTTWGETAQIASDGRVWSANPRRAATANILQPSQDRTTRPTSDRQPELSDEENTVWLRSANNEQRMQVVDSTGAILLDLPAMPGDGSTDRFGMKTFARSNANDTVAIPRTNKRFEIYQLSTQKLLKTVTLDGQPAVAEFSANGRRLFLADDAGVYIMVDVPEMREMWRHKDSSSGSANAAVFSPNGRQVAIARWDEQASILDTDTGHSSGRALHASEPLKSIAWSPDSRRIVTGGLDGTLLLWDAATQRQVTILQSTGLEICDIRFLDKGATLATADQSGITRLWKSDMSP